MREKLNLLTGSVFRGFQMLFAIVVLGLSATLVKHYGDGWEKQDKNSLRTPSSPWTLSLATGIGALSLVAAVISLVTAWTNLLREYIEMIVDVIVVVVNVVGGVMIAVILKGKSCSDTSLENRKGNSHYPYEGSLGGIAILNGGCRKLFLDNDGHDVWSCGNTESDDRLNQLNVRCKQSRSNSVFMFFTVVVCFGAMALTFLRLKKSI